MEVGRRRGRERDGGRGVGGGLIGRERDGGRETEREGERWR